GARAALEHVQTELVVELAVDELLTRLFHAGQDLAAELAAGEVGPGRRHLDHREGLDQIGIQPQLNAGDMEIRQRSRRLHPVVRIGGYGELTEEVVVAWRRWLGPVASAS